MSVAETPSAVSRAEPVRLNFPRNAAAMVVFDSVWTTGCGFILLAPTIPSYLTAMKASGTVMQLVTLAIPLLTGLQLWSGAVCGGPDRLRKLFRVWLSFPACWMAYGLVALAGWGRLPDEAFVYLFILACLGLGVFMHLGQPAYGELALDCTPLRWRGRLAGLRYVIASVLGLGGVWLASFLKGHWTGMDKFHYGMVVGGGFMAVSCLSIRFIRDPRDAPGTHGQDAHATAVAGAQPSPLVAARELLRNRRFRVFLLFFGVTMASQSLAPLVVRYGLKVLGMGQEGFTGASFVGTLAAAMAVAPLADRFGFRLLGILSAGMLAAAFAIMLIGDPGRWQALAAYALWGGASTLAAIVLANLGSELAPGFSPATVIAVGMVLAMPLSLGAAPLGGLLTDLLGPAGYTAAFAGGGGLATIALLGFLLAIREPREIHWTRIELRGA